MCTAQGVKILGKDLEKTLAGLPLLVAHKEDEVAVLRVRLAHLSDMARGGVWYMTNVPRLRAVLKHDATQSAWI